MSASQNNLTPAQIEEITAALRAALDVFSELDQQDWPQNDSQFFHGNSGTCPVYYDGAHTQVIEALSILESPATDAKPNS